MEIGDLVTCDGTIYVKGKPKRWVGLVMEKAQPKRWRVLWNNGQIDNIPESMIWKVEAICK